jgi:hypothetical protein
MKNYTKFLIPTPIFVIFSILFFKIASNEIPFWYKGLSDPSYLYLESTLHIALGEFPTHVDNPGAPIQDIGALTFRIVHFLDGKGSFVEDVLTRSEYYLKVLRYVLVSISCISIWLAGFFAFQISKNHYTTILIQLSPVLSDSVLGSIHRFQTISPEIFFIPLGLLWLIFFLSFIEIEEESKNSLKTAIWFSVIVGLMVATKLTLLPYSLIPLFLIKKLKNKALYVFFSVIFFLLFAFFQFFSSEKLFLWIRDLFFASGAYGTGKRTFIDFENFFENITLIISNEPLLITVLVVNTLIFAISKIRKFAELRLLLVLRSLFFTEVIYVIMNAKHYVHTYYMYGVVFIICANIILWIHLIKNSYSKVLFSAIITGAMFLFLPYHLVHIFQTDLQSQKDEIARVKNFYEKYPNRVVVTEYDAISQPYAFSFGIASFAPELRNPFGYFLKKKYPNDFYFCNGSYTYWGEKISIDSVLNNHKDFLYHFGNNNPPKYFNMFQVADSLYTMSGNKIYFYVKKK